MAFFTAAMNTSPISAVVPVDEPSTRITESSLAPVLSATRTRVYGRIKPRSPPSLHRPRRPALTGTRPRPRTPRAPSRCRRDAARLRVTVLRTAGRGAVAVAAARGAAVVFLAAVVCLAAVVFVAVDFAAVVFLLVFSAIRRSLSFLQHGQRARDAAAGGGQPP